MLKLEDFGVKREETALSNGAKLVLYKRLKTPVSIRVNFLSGSRFDPIGKEGTSHFLEHMIVAGSKRFPSKDKLAAYIEQYGGRFGASTSADILGVDVAIGDPKDFNYACEILHEILLAPLFDVETIETERGSILKELGAKKSNPSNMLWEVWRRLFFQETAVGRSILGSEETIASISKKDLIEFRDKYFTTGRLSFVVSGDIEIQELKNGFENKLMLPNSEPYLFTDDLPVVRKQIFSVEPYEKIDQVYIMYGFRAPRILNPDEYALDVIAEILGGGRASTLNKKLRYEKGLVYSASAWLSSLADCGSWAVMTSTSKDKINEVVEIITKEIKRIMENGLTHEEIEFAKNKIIKSKLMEMQTSGSWVDFHSFYESVNKTGVWTLEDYLREIELVTCEKTKEVANKYFGPDKWFLGMCGDIKEEDVKVAW